MSGPLRWFGALAALPAAERARLVDRTLASDRDLRAPVAELLRQVREEKDAALRDFARRFDGVELAELEVPRARWDEALERIPSELRRALERAQRNIAAFHAAQRPVAVELETEPGVRVGRRPDPLRRVGVYAPGGRAAYPSSVLMGAVPAKVAGVAEVIVCSPPGKNGLPPDVVLAAAAIAGADRVFALGGAGAIGALAYGTESVPAVDRIVGPGNAWVAEAKLQVQHKVAIDSPAGPSELLVIGDEAVDPATAARELIAQAEHDPDACVVAVVVGEAKARAIAERLAAGAPKAGRAEVVLAALKARGAVLWVESLGAIWPFAAELAPEHLLLDTRDAERDLARVRNAGTVFVGRTSSVAHGDYLTGANHVLPTAGLARAYSGLSLLDFYRWTSWQQVSRDAAARMASDVGTLADSEGLFGHAAAARAWEVKP